MYDPEEYQDGKKKTMVSMLLIDELMSKWSTLEESGYCFIIENLGANVSRDQLWEVFGAYGAVNQVEVNEKLRLAAIIFA
jgi:RNA recognition motif-containing protein